MFEKGIVTKVLADPVIGPMLGAPANDARLYPVVLPQGVKFPAMVYQIIDTGASITQDGPDNLLRHRVTFTAWSTVYSVTKQLGDAIQKMFHGFKGALPDGTAVQSAVLVDMRPTFEADPNLHRRDIDIEFWFVEVV